MERNLLLLSIPMARPLRGQPGFTLIELLVTIAIAAILLTVAVPNFMTFVQNNRLTAQANDLVTAFNYARSEAIKRGVRTAVCSSTDGTSCAASTSWDTGWLVLVDCNNNGAVDAGVCPDWDANGAADDEPVLLVRQSLENGNTLRMELTNVTYQNTGFSGNAGTFRLCDVRGKASGRAIAVSMQGRVSTTVGTASCP